MKKINVAILGATGVVGQAFIKLLENSEYFKLESIVASSKNLGKNYKDAVKWQLPGEIPFYSKHLKTERFNIQKFKDKNIKIVFSALPADTALLIEAELVANGFYVFSNSSAFRADENVPITVADVNPESIDLIKKQGFPEKGFVVTNPNCSTSGLVTAIAPLVKFGIKEIFCSTYQSYSGAGYPGLSAFDILDNAIPYISSEEDKMKFETHKILGINPKIYPFCVRIPVKFGHLETIWLTVSKNVSKEEIIKEWQQENNLLNYKPIFYREELDYPQPKNAFDGENPGMTVQIGRLKIEEGKIGFVLLVNNIIKGAAGGSISNAELFLKNKNFIR